MVRWCSKREYIREIDQQRSADIVNLELVILQDLTVIMAILVTSVTLFTLLLALGTSTISGATDSEAVPTSIVVIPDNGDGGCPSDVDRQDALQLLRSRTENILQNLQNYSNNPNCGPGLWRRVFYLNTSSQDQSCPGDWRVRANSSDTGCVGAEASCQSAYSEEISFEYSKVCGRVIGSGSETPDAFLRFISNQTTIEDNYLDGVSVTHGAPGSRTHIWSFGAGHPASILLNLVFRCPCDNSDLGQAPLPPSEVGENYFCSTTYSGDRLWSGSDCNSASSCCSFHNPPYFSVQLPSPTTDQIELRICTDEAVSGEPVSVLFAEIYVQ